jgi:hypothetical protein
LPTPYVKDAFHQYLVHGKADAVNPEARGTKAAARYHRTINAGATITLQLRLASLRGGDPIKSPFAGFDAVLNQRKQQATNSTQSCCRRIFLRIATWWRAKGSRACCGRSSIITMSSRNGWKATRPSQLLPPNAWTDETKTGRICFRVT